MSKTSKRVLLATPPVYQAPLPLEVHLPMIPQGPAMIGAVLRERGHDVSCFDAYEQSCRLGYFDADEFADQLALQKPDWLGLSVYSDGFPAVLRMIEIAKDVVPTCRIAVGGPHFTIFPEAVPPEVDVVVVGEGEIAMAAIVEASIPDLRSGDDDPRRSFEFHLQSRGEGRPFDGRCNLSFKVHVPGGEISEPPSLQTVRSRQRRARNGATRILILQDRLSNEALGRLPFPAYDLFLKPEASYQQDEPALGLEGPMLNLNTSRGCSYGCSFCSVEGVWGKPYRWFPSEWVLGLVRKLKVTYGIRSVFFREDQFIMRPRAPSAWEPELEGQDEVLALAKGLQTLGIRWAIENRADAFGPPARAECYFKALAELGLAGVFVGIESASETVRNGILNKNLSLESIRAFFAWARDRDVKTVANIMFGVRRRVNGKVLADGPDDWRETEALLQDLGPTRTDRYVYVGVPVSAMYDDHLHRGDYEFIDVNGYLYPKGFTEIARKMYASNMTMAKIPGKPNLKVGPGLLPGIPGPSGDAERARGEVAQALAYLRRLPGVAGVNLNSLDGSIPFGAQRKKMLKDLIGSESHSALPLTALDGLPGRFRPGAPPEVVQLPGQDRLAVATLRSPSAEAMILALSVSGEVHETKSLLSALHGAVENINAAWRNLYIESHDPAGRPECTLRRGEDD